MKLEIGQVWKITGWDRYWRVATEHGPHDFVLTILFPYDTDTWPDIIRSANCIASDFELVDDILCVECGTARARYNLNVEVANGLKCWSCHGGTNL